MPRRGSTPSERSTAPAIPDIVEGELSPELKGAVSRLTADRDRLRAELAKARARITSLERLADEDALAPVANRRAFVRQLSRMIAYAHRYGVPASLVYFDVNNMKQINDTHGHAAGDAALCHIAKVLRDNIRSSDIVGRLGGDEFGVVLAQSDRTQAESKAGALAEAIAATPLRWGTADLSVTAAYGVRVLAETDDAQHAIEAADRAMYAQKRATLLAEP